MSVPCDFTTKRYVCHSAVDTSSTLVTINRSCLGIYLNSNATHTYREREIERERETDRSTQERRRGDFVYVGEGGGGLQFTLLSE